MKGGQRAASSATARECCRLYSAARYVTRYPSRQFTAMHANDMEKQESLLTCQLIYLVVYRCQTAMLMPAMPPRHVKEIEH